MNFNRVTVDKDINGADGRLRVARGATGIIVGRLCGLVDVLFDDGPSYVELSGCARRFQSIPFICTTPVK